MKNGATIWPSSQQTFTCSKLKIETVEHGVKYVQNSQKRYQNVNWRRSGIFFVNFEHISHHVQAFLLLTLNIWLPAGKADWRVYLDISKSLILSSSFLREATCDIKLAMKVYKRKI